MPDQGDIVLIPIPFTDLLSQKRRPVIIISNESYNRHKPDMVVVAMTSTPPVGDYSFTITSADLELGSLSRPGTVRVDKIYSLLQTLTVKTFGRVNNQTPKQIRKLLHDLVSKKP